MGNVREMAARINTAQPARFDEPMENHTSFRIGGPADLYITPRNTDELTTAYLACREAAVPVFLLGGGSNILVSDRGIRGAVIDLAYLGGVVRTAGGLSAACGALMSNVAEAALGYGLCGLEFCYALPGSVGGAVWMNARCYGKSVSDVLISVETLGTDGTRTHTMNPEEWGYKRSPFQGTDAVILRADFRLDSGDTAAISEEMQGYREDRVAKGHFRYPCAGSIFKNNREFGQPTGKIVDSLGLKGRRCGQAQIAPFHGNIIVNLGGASAREVRGLIELIESEVSQKLGFRLEREVILVGEW